jgi:Magnesium chelatase, subunit ChlI
MRDELEAVQSRGLEKFRWGITECCSWMSYRNFNVMFWRVMRQPLEDRMVTIARAAVSGTFPSRFMLAVAMNP